MKTSPITIHHKLVLRRLGLPPDLIKIIREGRLEAEVEKAYKRWEHVNEVMDAFEEQDPVLARSCQWYEARQEWKRNGRQRPEWWEVLALDVPPCRLDAQTKRGVRKTWLSAREIRMFQQTHQRHWKRTKGLAKNRAKRKSEN
jgi:hypothetical protein